VVKNNKEARRFIRDRGDTMAYYERVKKLLSKIFEEDDLMSQDNLFELQDMIARLALQVAKDEKKTKDLVESFSWLYRIES